MDMLHSEELKKVFDDATLRVYQALLDMDRVIAADVLNGCNQPPKNIFSWVAENKYRVEWFLSEREVEIRNWAKNTQNAIANKLQVMTI